MNLLLIVMGVILLWRVITGFKEGMVKEIISFVSLVVMSVAIILLAIALNSYMGQNIMKMIVAVILLLVLCIAHRIISVVFFSAKLIAKLPVVHGLDRLLGGVVGVMETVVILWVVYALIMNFGLGVIGEQIILYVKESRLLTFLYENNYLAYGVSLLSEKAALIPLDMEDVTDAAENVKDIFWE